MKLHRCALFAAAFLAATASVGFPQARAEKTSIALPTTTVTFMPVYIAQDMGFWKEQGLDVKIHNFRGMASTNAMLAGSVDFAVQSGPSLIRGNIRGTKMLGIALMADGVAFEIDMTKKAAGTLRTSSPLKERAKSLAGKTISVDSPKTVVEGVLRYISAKGGVNPDRDIRMTYMQPPEAIAALLSGSIDAAVLNFPWTISAQREGAVLIASGITDVPELLPTAATTTTTRPDFCKKHRSVCIKLVKGYVMAHAFLLDHPDKALEIAEKRMPRANVSDITKSFPQMLKTTPRIPRYSEAAFKHAQQLMLVGGMITKKEALSSFRNLYTNEFVNIAVGRTHND